MKKLLIICMSIVGLVSCGERLPQDQWVKESADLTRVDGLSDCKFITLERSTNAYPIYVIRCPLSSTTSSSMHQAGKSTRIESVSVDETLSALELEKAEKIRKLKAQLQTLEQ